MKVLITFVLLLAAWAGCPLEVMAQQANTTVSRTVDLAKGYYIVRIGDTVRKVSIR